jgi:hypothetical protein
MFSDLLEELFILLSCSYFIYDSFDRADFIMVELQRLYDEKC